jgi:hypothetical protein
MTKARTLANFISDNNEFADGTISVAEVSGAAPLASPTFTGTTTVSGDFNVFNNTGASASYDFKSDHYTQLKLTSDVDASAGGPYEIMFTANGSNGKMELRTNNVEYLGIDQAGKVVINEGGADADFRVESDGNTHMLFVDASANAVAIGSASTSTAARLRAAVSSVASGDSIVLIDSANDANVAGNHLHIKSLRGDTSAYNLLTIDNVVGEILNISGNGSVVFNEAGADRDFRIEGDNLTSLFFLDAGNDRIHIGNTAGTYTFNVNSQTTGSPTGAMTINAALNNSGEGLFIDCNTRGYTEESERAFRVRDRQAYNAFIVQVGGSTIINDDSAAWQDFRVESNNNANMLFVDAGIDRVGIGEGSPVSSLDVKGSQSATALTVRSGDNNSASGGGKQILLSYDGTANYGHNIRTRHDY